ncbi:MAG TPA: CpsD/CapB family tyrosine-protein kinase [Candidatus Polarisedimenticolia bacterium]|nr:CpsD/CapB family tyrosine-protein kinase [Candidatus Polarisedimenticolia bacterium]
MSRIHEALKKAEQERAAQGGPSQGSFAATVAAEPPAGASAEEQPIEISANVRESGGVPLTSAMPTFASPFSLDTLLGRCVPQQWSPDEKTMLFFHGDDSARGTEEFRTLRSRLYHAREKMPLKKVLVTSALPKEGKSFTAANLAQVLVRQHGRRVLLIDADLRGPRLHMMLGTTSSPGLVDYLQGDCDEFSIMQRGPMENLFFIPSGQETSNPAELVSNGRLKTLLQRVEALFDWIIVDSPPAVPVSDAGVLAKACDGVLLVVRSNTTPVDMARRARQEFPDDALVGVVLNGANADAMPYTRYYYDSYQKNGTESKT